MSLFVFLRFLFTFAFLKMNVKLSVLSVHLSLKKKKKWNKYEPFNRTLCMTRVFLDLYEEILLIRPSLLKKKEVFWDQSVPSCQIYLFSVPIHHGTIQALWRHQTTVILLSLKHSVFCCEDVWPAACSCDFMSVLCWCSCETISN